MSRVSAALLGAVVFLGSTGARVRMAIAEPAPPAERRVRIGLGFGRGLPFGSYESDTTMRSSSFDQTPLSLEAGYLIGGHVVVGAYAQYGFMSNGYESPCSYWVGKCSKHTTTVGIQAQYHMTTDELLDPWVGVGVGYERLNFHAKPADGATYSVTSVRSGIELVKLQGGLDFRLARAFSFGPFVSYSVGEYLHRTDTFSGAGGEGSQSINLAPASHQWLTLGVKGTVAL
jgi:outer membrane protein W